MFLLLLIHKNYPLMVNAACVRLAGGAPGRLVAAGARRRRRLLVIDDFARLRSLEPWFVDRFLPALPETVTVVVADRAAPVWPAGGDGVALALAPLAEADARRYLALRGVADEHHA